MSRKYDFLLLLAGVTPRFFFFLYKETHQGRGGGLGGAGSFPHTPLLFLYFFISLFLYFFLYFFLTVTQCYVTLRNVT